MAKGLKVNPGLPEGIIYCSPPGSSRVPWEKLQIIAGETKLFNIVLEFFEHVENIKYGSSKMHIIFKCNNFLLADLSSAGKWTHYLASPVYAVTPDLN